MSLAAPMVFAVIGIVLMVACWRYEHSPLMSPRAVPFIAAAAAFFLLFGLPPVLYAISGAFYSDSGMTALLGLDVFGFLVCFFEPVLAHKFHPIGTPFLCSWWGFSLAVTFADWPTVTHYVAKLPSKALKSIGHEAHHNQASKHSFNHVPHHDYVILVLFVVGVIAAGIIALVAHKRREEKRQNTGQEQPALPQRAAPEGLGIGTYYAQWRADRKAKKRSKGAFHNARAALDGPRPPRGAGPRTEVPNTPAVRN